METRALTAVSELTEALSRARKLDEVYAAALDALQRSLSVDRASVLMFDANAFMGFVAWRGISEAYRAAVNGHTPWTPETSNPEPVLVSDVEADASLTKYQDVFRSERIRALGFFPLNYRDRVIGKFMLYYGEPHAFDADEIQLAKTIAGQIAFGVARIRAEEALAVEGTRLVDMVTHVPGMVWEILGEPGNATLIFVSEGIRDLVGYDPEDWYSNPRFWDDLLVDSDAGPAREQARRAAADGSVQVHEFRMRRRDGSIVWVQTRSTHRFAGDKIISRGVTTDITAEKEAANRTRILNEASAVLASSLQYESTLGRVAHLATQGFAEACAVDLVTDQGEIDRVCQSGNAPLIDHLDGRSRVIAQLSVRGRTLGAMTFVANAGQRYAQEDRDMAMELARRAAYAIDNARLYRRAQEANRAKDEFLATLSHELRTPMTATLGWAGLLRTGNVSPENLDAAIEAINQSTRAQAKLIDDILDVSRIVTGKLQLTLVPIHLPAVVQAAVDALRPSIEAKNLRLDVRLEPIARAPTGDAGRLQQVVSNLLSNAVKFTPPGGSIEVTVSQASPQSARITVRDSGAGIPKSFLPFLFERYRQADSSSTRGQGGLGLGLAIVKSLVEAHGGSVTAWSEGEGNGALFTVMLPIATAAATATAAGLAPAPPEQSLLGVSVLVVEDDDATRGMLTAVLRSYGADVTAADSAPAAFEELRKKKPSVILSDIAMPGEDGCSLLMRLRSGFVEHCDDIPAIALTAYAAPEERERILRSGFGYHLAKPVDPITVVAMVRQATQH